MWEAFVTLVIGLPAALWQVMSKKDKRKHMDDLLLTIVIVIIIYLIIRIFS